MNSTYIVIIFVLGFLLGIGLMVLAYDRISYSKAAFFCRNIEPECNCHVEGHLMYYKSVYYLHNRKVEKEFKQ